MFLWGVILICSLFYMFFYIYGSSSQYDNIDLSKPFVRKRATAANNRQPNVPIVDKYKAVTIDAWVFPSREELDLYDNDHEHVAAVASTVAITSPVAETRGRFEISDEEPVNSSEQVVVSSAGRQFGVYCGVYLYLSVWGQFHVYAHNINNTAINNTAIK